MRKILLLLLLLFFCFSVFAEDKIIKTDIEKINIETWIEDNKSHYKIYFDTENMEGDSYFEKTGEGNLTNETFSIRFIRDLECNETVESFLVDYFEECDSGNEKVSCREAFITCEADKKYYENLSTYFHEYIRCSDSKSNINSKYEILKNEFRYNMSDCNNTISNLKREKQNTESTRLYWCIGIAGIIIAYYNRGKFGRTKEEKELGMTGKSTGAVKYFRDLLGGKEQGREGGMRIG